MYGCAAINISDRNIKLLDSSQGNFVKTILSIPYSSRTTPILQSLHIDPVSISVKRSELNLLQQCLLRDSTTQSFYRYLFSVWNNGEFKLLSNTLLYRVLSYCEIKHINFKKYISNDVYKKCIKGSFEYTVIFICFYSILLDALKTIIIIIIIIIVIIIIIILFAKLKRRLTFVS